MSKAMEMFNGVEQASLQLKILPMDYSVRVCRPWTSCDEYWSPPWLFGAGAALKQRGLEQALYPKFYLVSLFATSSDVAFFFLERIEMRNITWTQTWPHSASQHFNYNQFNCCRWFIHPPPSPSKRSLNAKRLINNWSIKHGWKCVNRE